MIIETEEHRNILKAELDLYDRTRVLAETNKRFNIKCASLLVEGLQQSVRIVCGNFANFRTTTYNTEKGFHPEYTVLDMFSTELENLTLYVAKLNIRNEALPSRPCKFCMKAIRAEEQIRNLVYQDENLRIVSEVLE